MATTKQLTEMQVRELRDRVYGKPIEDKGWDACKDRWMQPEEIAWLQSQKPHKNL